MTGSPVPARRFMRSEELRRRAHAVIPGGAHTYAKGDDQYPVEAPGFIARGRGCYVWDVDGNRFVEYGAGLRSVTLGHGHPAVTAAVSRQSELGTNFVRPTLLEVEVAEQLRAFVGQPEAMVKFAKNGSDVTTAALRLARAATGRDTVAICSDQPFFSVDDWFIGATPMDAGVPRRVAELTVGFRYGDLQDLRNVFDRNPGRIAAVVMEGIAGRGPEEGYLEGVRDLCREHGALWILDEMIAGFRVAHGGASERYGVSPDLLCYGKGMGNGFAVSALVGRREIMELGGLEHSGPRVFLLSYTHGAESASLAAARAVMHLYGNEDVIGDLWRAGEQLDRGFRELAARRGVQEFLFPSGLPCNLVYVTLDAEGRRSQAFRALFMQELIRGGVLAPSLVVSRAHDDAAIAATLRAVDRAMAVYAQALEEGVDGLLEGRPVQPVFRRFNAAPDTPT